ncbi:transcriptional-regulating factor 1-like [Chaetodon auriga]|uniref:transcriptional-regulating factor 1-like n=1 Tax=Chaetodon auriga TaxID=39042 RepID=UPI004033099A
MSGEVALGRWSSVDFGSSPAEGFSGAQFFHDSFNAPQPFCSPNTPGPSPHYPQTPTISSPAPPMHTWEERLDFHTQASRQELDPYLMTPDPGQHHLHQTNQGLLQGQTGLIQDQTGLLDAAGTSESCFSPRGRAEDVSRAAPPPGPPAECGGGAGGGTGGGHGQADWTWMKRPKRKNSAEGRDCRLLCTLCNRDFSSLPALNGHMRSHSGFRSATWLNKGEDSSPLVPASVSTLMPVNVPAQSRGSAKACRSTQRRCGHLGPAGTHAVLYHSLLRVQDEDAAVSGGGDGAVTGDDGVHYTPPPMLCPLRAGPGLYCSLTTRRQQRVQTVQLHNTHNGLNDLVAMEAASPSPGTVTTGTNKPRINVGRGFQAEIPPLLGRKNAHSDSQNALLLWTPWEELECPINKQRVEALLMMARSSVVPGGVASPESALHVLSQCRGDFLLTVEKLLSTPETSNNNRAARPSQSVGWSAAERTLLLQSLQLHGKDFVRMQKAVQTKSVSQCVEFYYLWKKKLSLSARTPAGLTVTLPDANVKGRQRSHDAS